MTQSRYNYLSFAMVISTAVNLNLSYPTDAKITALETNFHPIKTNSKTDFDKSNANAVLCRRHARQGFKQAFYDYSYAHQYQTYRTNKHTHEIICN